jgi:hypothetical protein
MAEMYPMYEFKNSIKCVVTGGLYITFFKEDYCNCTPYPGIFREGIKNTTFLGIAGITRQDIKGKAPEWNATRHH